MAYNESMKDALIFTLTVIIGLHAFVYAVEAHLPELAPLEVSFGVDEVSEDVIETQTKVPILMYHYVRDVDINQDQIGWNLSVSPELFEQQLQYLDEQEYVTIHLSDLLDGTVPDNAVVLTFDDGLSDFYTEAMPLLQKYNMTASNSIISGMIGDGNHMTVEEIWDVIDSGIEITAHTVTHPNLVNLRKEDAIFEIEGSRDSLEDIFGVEINAFVYPSGKNNQTVVSLLEEAGYEIALTTAPGVADLENDKMLLLPRIRIDNRDGFAGFVKKMEGADAEVAGVE